MKRKAEDKEKELAEYFCLEKVYYNKNFIQYYYKCQIKTEEDQVELTSMLTEIRMLMGFYTESCKDYYWSLIDLPYTEYEYKSTAKRNRYFNEKTEENIKTVYCGEYTLKELNDFLECEKCHTQVLKRLESRLVCKCTRK